MIPPTGFETPRLVLRKPHLNDAEAIYRTYASDPGVVRYVVWSVHDTAEETRNFLRRCLDEWSQASCFPYVIEIVGDHTGPVGMIDLRRRSHVVNFGYVLARPHWGKGIMAEALSTLLDWSLEQPEIWRASAFCDIDNLASARVMEKAGMAFEGILRRYFVHPNVSPEPRDCKIYAKVRTSSD